MIQDIYPHQLRNSYKPGCVPTANDYLFYFQSDTVLLHGTEPAIRLLTFGDFDSNLLSAQAVYLFSIDERACFLIFEEPAGLSGAMNYQSVQIFRTLQQPEVAWTLLVALHLRNWYLRNRYCGACGAENQHKSDERAMQCPSCGQLYFPAISPAIIVAIRSGEKILLASNNNFKGGWYSLIAGYADVGETLEETVRREVMEEVGLQVTNIRYYSSQPWPLSGSMMIGFTAEADENQPIHVDTHELTHAAWFTRDQLPAHSSTISIAGEMIDLFEKGML